MDTNDDETGPVRDHLFVSYATEDSAFAEWLALKLTAEGYKVWIDRFKLLGGEPYPSDIDSAIKNRTFRLLALLSRHSVQKENPRKERTLALNLQRERGEEILIPVNVDGLSPTELDWMVGDLTFIPFADSWAAGLRGLLKKLEKVEAPRWKGEGKEVAAQVFLSEPVLTETPEPLFGNLLEFEHIPSVVRCHTTRRDLSTLEHDVLSDDWAFWALPPSPGSNRSQTLFYSFDPPPRRSGLGSVRWDRVEEASWRDVRSITRKKPQNIVKPLLRRVILHALRRRGLQATPEDQQLLYFPPDLLPDGRLTFQRPDGSTGWRKVVGEREYRGEKFRYHQAVTFDVLTDLEPQFIARFRIRLHITGLNGEPLGPQSANARRKYITRSWWNRQWYDRHLAICGFLRGDGDRIVIGNVDPVVVSGSLLRLDAPYGIEEEAVPSGTPYFVSDWDDDEEVDDNGEVPPEAEGNDAAE